MKSVALNLIFWLISVQSLMIGREEEWWEEVLEGVPLIYFLKKISTSTLKKLHHLILKNLGWSRNYTVFHLPVVFTQNPWILNTFFRVKIMLNCVFLKIQIKTLALMVYVKTSIMKTFLQFFLAGILGGLVVFLMTKNDNDTTSLVSAETSHAVRTSFNSSPISLNSSLNFIESAKRSTNTVVHIYAEESLSLIHISEPTRPY